MKYLLPIYLTGVNLMAALVSVNGLLTTIQRPTEKISSPTRYDITLECQRLSAMSMDKFRTEERDGKQVKVVFKYEDCIKELNNAIEPKILKV